MSTTRSTRMDEMERVNSAAFKANLTYYRDKVKIGKTPIIIQQNNKDQVALVPLELLLEKQNRSSKSPRQR
jgi:PHD/YefM family antitoxin component YafN of YafNO toxin-antitoxin module